MDWIDVISRLGFPVAVCVAMGYFIWALYKQSVERENKLYSEITECHKINAQYANIISTYTDKLDVIQKDVATIKDDVTTYIIRRDEYERKINQID